MVTVCIYSMYPFAPLVGVFHDIIIIIIIIIITSSNRIQFSEALTHPHVWYYLVQSVNYII